MFVAWVVFHVIVCIALVLVVLMQSSKGEGLAGTALGGGSGLSGAVFGGRGAASFLSKATTVLAILFMVNSGALALMSAQRSGVATTTEAAPGQVESVVSREAQQELDQQLQLQQQQQAAGDTVSPVQLLNDSITPANPSGN